MKTHLLKPVFPVLLLLASSVAVHAAALPNLVFRSSFEESEACLVFAVQNDTINVPAVNISGQFTLNGNAFPNSEYDDAIFSLRDPMTGDVFKLGNSHDHQYSVNIVAGYYDVIYSVQTPGNFAPHNVDAVLQEDVALLTNRVLNINVIAHSVSGDFMHNGNPFPASQYDHGIFFLDGERTGRVELGDTKFLSFENVPVLQGDYQIRYQSVQAATVPWNTWGFAGGLNIAADNNSLDIDIQSVTLGGRFTQNGTLMPASEYDDGEFYLETASGDRVFLENSHFQSYEKPVMLGNYDVFWELETPGSTVPFNVRARVGSDLSVAGGTLNVNIVSYPVSGNFTLNGGVFPASALNTGQIVLRDQLTQAENVLGLTLEGTYKHQVIEGNYDFVYQHLQGDDIPQNKNATLSTGVLVNSAEVFNINVTSSLFSAAVYHNGLLFPALQQQQANILFRNLASGDQVLFGKTSQQNLSAQMLPGIYDVYYSHLSGNEVPQNKMARFQQGLVVNAPGPSFNEGENQLQVNSMLATGQMLMNGSPMPVSEYDDGLLSFTWEEDTVLLGNTHDQNYEVRLLNNPNWDDFLIQFKTETTGPTIPANGDARFRCVRLAPLQ